MDMADIQERALSGGRLWMPRWKMERRKGTVHSTETGVWRGSAATWRAMPASMLSWSVRETMGRRPSFAICSRSRRRAEAGVSGGVQ